MHINILILGVLTHNQFDMSLIYPTFKIQHSKFFYSQMMRNNILEANI